MTAAALDRDPPAWATALARHRDGLRRLIRSLLEEEAGQPMWALDALLAVIPAEDRHPLLELLRAADEMFAVDDGERATVDTLIDYAVHAYETHVAAAYQHGPHLGRWQDAARSADEAIGQHGAEAIEVITEAETRIAAALAIPIELVDEPAPHSDFTEDARTGVPHLKRDGSCCCDCVRCVAPDMRTCICPDCDKGTCPFHVEADALLADLAAIPVTVVQIGGAS